MSNTTPSPPKMTDPQPPSSPIIPPPPSTESTLAELTRASTRLEPTIALLHQRPSRTRYSPGRHPSITDRLTTIRHLLTIIKEDAPVDDSHNLASDRVRDPDGGKEWSALFHARFGECARSCDGICDRVGGGRGDVVRDGDLERVVEKLEEGLRVLVRAGIMDVQEQGGLLASKAVEDLFRELGRRSAELAERGSKRWDGTGLPALLRSPLRWGGVRRGSEEKDESGQEKDEPEQEKDEPEQEKDKPEQEKDKPEQEDDDLTDLARVRPWPPGSKTWFADPELREARRWSRILDRQISTDRYNAEWGVSTVLLFSPYCDCWGTDHETKLSLIDGLAGQSTNAKLEAARNVNLPGVREAVRRIILSKAKCVIDCLQKRGTLEEELSERCDGALSPMKCRDGTLDEEMGRLLGDLWRSEQFQEALRARNLGSRWFNDVLISAIDRASAEDYIPTLKDYRRFRVYHRHVSPETFEFDIDPVSIRILDPRYLSRTGKTKNLIKEFWAQKTSIIVPIDLAQYEACDCWEAEVGSDWDGERPTKPGRLVRMASTFSSIAEMPREREPLMVILILMNKEGLRLKLDRVPFSSVYSDYEGRDDSPDDVIEYTLNKIFVALDTSEDKGTMHIQCDYWTGEPSEESTLKHVFFTLNDIAIQQRLVAWGLVKKDKK